MAVQSGDTNSGLANRDILNLLDDQILEEIKQDMDGMFTTGEIRTIAQEICAEFEGAIITSFLPIFIYRRTREKLTRILDQTKEETN